MSIDESDAALQIVEAGRLRVIARLRDAFAAQVGATADLGDVDPVALDGLIAQAADRAGASLWRISLAEGAAHQYGITVGEALAHHAVAAAIELVGAPDEPEPVPTWATLPTATIAPPQLPEPAVYETAADEEWNDAQGGDAQDRDEDDERTYAQEPLTAVHAAVATEPAPELEPEPVAAQAFEAEAELEPVAAQAFEAETAGDPDGSTAPPQAIRITAIHTGGIETLKTGDKDLELRLSDAGLDVIRRSSGVAIGRLDWNEVTSVEIGQNRKGLRGKRSRSMEVRTARGQAAFELPGLSDEEAAEHLEPMLQRLRSSGTLGS